MAEHDTAHAGGSCNGIHARGTRFRILLVFKSWRVLTVSKQGKKKRKVKVDAKGEFWEM